MTIGARIIQARTARGWKQTTLAAILEDRGIMTQQSLSRLERGEANSTSKAFELAQVLGVRGAWLATGQGEMLSDGVHDDGLAVHKISDRLAALVAKLDRLDKAGQLPVEFLAGMDQLLSALDPERPNQNASD